MFFFFFGNYKKRKIKQNHLFCFIYFNKQYLDFTSSYTRIKRATLTDYPTFTLWVVEDAFLQLQMWLSN